MAYDDRFGDKGAVGYLERLTVKQVEQYGLKAISHEKTDTTVYLKVGDIDGRSEHAWTTSEGALEEAPPEDVQEVEGKGPIAPRIKDSGEVDEGGYRGDGVSEGTPVRGGVGNSDETVDIPPVRGSGTGTATGSDAISDVERIDYQVKPSDGLEGRNVVQRFSDNVAAIRDVIFLMFL